MLAEYGWDAIIEKILKNGELLKMKKTYIVTVEKLVEFSNTSDQKYETESIFIPCNIFFFQRVVYLYLPENQLLLLCIPPA